MSLVSILLRYYKVARPPWSAGGYGFRGAAEIDGRLRRASACSEAARGAGAAGADSSL